MLKYEFNKRLLGDDTVVIPYKYVTMEDYLDIYANTMLVTLYCEDVYDINSGDILHMSSSYKYHNDVMETQGSINETADFQVYTVDKVSKKICFIDSKYSNLAMESIVAEVKDRIIKLRLNFANSHGYGSQDADITIYVVYNTSDYVYLYDGLEYVDFSELDWTYDGRAANAREFMGTLFPEIDVDNPVDGEYVGILDKVIVSRPQLRWGYSDQDNPIVYVERYNLNLDVPIKLTTRTDLYKEGNINDYFVQVEKEKAINSVVDMERRVYSPVVITTSNGKKYIDCTRINFNLHFRLHSGKDWTVENSDTWNFVKYGEEGGTEDRNKYYSYGDNVGGLDDDWNVSCQSDLLGYLSFTTNDVRYQKNKLGKSFIRLSFYDSPNAGSQNLLAYSTVFVDLNKLYSKYITKFNLPCYFDSDGEPATGIKVDREVDEDALARLLHRTNKPLSKDEIEEYRLSSQLEVHNKYSTTNSSEGFYLYLWEDDTDRELPTDVYMKVEYNHAGYGRNIPMMAPYKDNAGGFKTNEEIKTDWEGPSTQYGIKRYLRYSYIHFKTRYDADKRRYIYYLDPETYGVTREGDKKEPIININLYEARIAF